MAWQERYTPEGFWQFREVLDNGRASRWRFYIFGFAGNPGEPGTCRVRTADGHRDCAIDARNRVLIAGRWRSPLDWGH